MQSHNDTSGSAHLEHYEDGDNSPTNEQPAREAQLDHYEEDEVATAPWPPRAD